MPFDVDYRGTVEEQTEVGVKTDSLFLSLIEKTPEEIDAFFASNLSALSGLTDVQIEAYIDTNYAALPVAARDALKILAKDTAFNSRVLKLLAKAVPMLARKVRDD